MPSVFDVAAYLLNKHGPMTAMKLQKLIYYSQAWSLVWDEAPLFAEPIEAWANGPVVRVLYEAHRGCFMLQRRDLQEGNARTLSGEQKETVDAVLRFYGDKSSQFLSDLTHKEDPWRNARAGLRPSERGSSVISHAALAEYYGSLQQD